MEECSCQLLAVGGCIEKLAAAEADQGAAADTTQKHVTTTFEAIENDFGKLVMDFTHHAKDLAAMEIQQEAGSTTKKRRKSAVNQKISKLVHDTSNIVYEEYNLTIIRKGSL